MQKKPPVDKSDKLWLPQVQSGYDPKSGKYRSYKGPFVKRQVALEEASPEEVYGAVAHGNFTPLSHAAESLERLVAGMDVSKMNKDWFKETNQNIRSIPASILARMKLAEYYASMEGDVFQTMAIPMEVGLRFESENDVQIADKGAERALRDFYSDDTYVGGMDLYQTLYDAWLSMEIYGTAFPLVVLPRIGDDPDGRFDKSRIPAVLCLNPKTVWVGKVWSVSQWDSAITEEDVEKWDRNLIEKSIPPMMYVALVMRDNEMLQMGKIPINPDYMHPVHDWKLNWERYAIPHLTRAFRAISTRQVLEEMIRNTIEGFKNQLWVFKVGTDQNPASPQKIARLNAILNSLATERTGQIIFTHDLVVEQHTPKPLDQLLANEAWLSLTFHMFTQIGMNPYFVSGLKQTRGASGTLDLDISLFVERLKHTHKQMSRLEKFIRSKWCEWDGCSEAIRTKVMQGKVSMGSIDFGAQQLIKEKLQPLAQLGYLSDQTAIEMYGGNYELELARKKAGQKNAELFAPKPSFAQQTVNPGTPETETKTSPQGRPQEGNKNADQDVEVEAATSGNFRL
jgi:hypothetical protein